MAVSPPTLDPDWVRQQVRRYSEVRPLYEEYARVLARTLKAATRSRAPMAIVETRAKSVASFAEKVQRKR
ncbi:MAG: hypothetical protein PVJ27_09575, partial [Candidatus Brocadiaceae bacterium]